MRRFILGQTAPMATYPTALPLTAGQVCFAAIANDAAGTNNTGVIIDSDGTKIKNVGYILYNDGTHQKSFPIYKHNFSYVKSVYSAGKVFTCDVTIPIPTAGLEYTMILVKKGMEFNYRNKWTATVRATDGETADTLAAKIRKYFSSNADALDITVSGATNHVIITGKNKRQDYEIIFADELMGTARTPTHAEAPVNDAEAIKNMWIEAAADIGYTDTYDDFLLRCHYPLNPLRASDTVDTGFIVYTLRFSEPRHIRTVDTPINQIVQIAFPTSTNVAEIEAVLAKLAE